ncbi:hypothetical protein ACF1G3_37890 [Streptomyces rochei]|uniref:hypothetical protein n=1 Tax=Streptomyces rochei TaxID=1928 RepID=UPI0036F70C44
MFIDLTAIVVLVLGGLAVYIAYKRPELANALGVGAVIITLLVLLLQDQEETKNQQMGGSPTTAGQTCPAPKH